VRGFGYDRQNLRYPHRPPETTVVALAEGSAATSFSSSTPSALGGGADQSAGYSRFPPRSICAAKLLPLSAAIRPVGDVAHSALGLQLDGPVERQTGPHCVFITAEGLLMYLYNPTRLCAGPYHRAAKRFLPAAELLFESTRRPGFAALSRLGMRTSTPTQKKNPPE